MDTLTIQDAEKITLKEAEKLRTTEGRVFWARDIVIEQEPGSGVRITMFADSPEKLAL